MIIFKKVRFKNFMSYGGAMTEITLNDKQLTAILGQNGCGKSTILSAINFALYGKSFNSAQKSKIVNSINGKNMITEVEFTTNGHDYKVVRGMKPNVFEIYQDTVLLTKEANVKDYQTILESQILKMTMKNFMQTVLVGTASFIPFMELSASDRRTVIENILGVGVLTQMNNLLRAKMQDNSSQLQTITSDLRNIKVRLGAEKAMINTLKTSHSKNMEKIKVAIENNQSEIDKIQKSLDTLLAKQTKLSPITEAYEKFKSSQTEFMLEQKQITSKITRVRKDISSITKHDVCPFCKQDISEDHKHKISEELESSIKETETQLERVSKKLESLNKKEEKFLKAMDTLSALTTKISEKTTAISMLNRENAKFTSELNTPETLDDVKEHEENVVKLVREAKETLEEKNENLTRGAIMAQASLLLKDSGIKTAVVNQYLPIINHMVNKFLSDMDFFLSFELDSQFNETIKARDRDDFTYQNLSQGERRRLDLAILFTWRHIASLRNSCATNLLIVDEVLDSSLDEEGANMALNLFRSMKDSNIFIISHRESIQDSRFDKILRVRKEKQFSILTEE